MVSSNEQNLIYDIKISTVSAGFISGCDAAQELTGMDLAMKLHYLRLLYFFPKPAFDGLTILNIKETMFIWLNYAYIPCGRLRKTDSGRPFIKCNDSGVRIIEAKCELTLDEWLESRDDSRDKLLVPNQVLGPDLFFTPLVFIQLTKFKCGGTSIGMSWSHLLGDAFSAMSFIKIWGQVITGHYSGQPLTMAQPKTRTFDLQSPNESPYPLSIKRVDPVENLWSTSNVSKMVTFSFGISMSKLSELQAKICQEKTSNEIPMFESICVVIWQSMAKVTNGPGPNVVTICKSDLRERTKGIITNRAQTIGLVKTGVSLERCTPIELGSLIMNEVEDERMKIEEAMGKDDELPDILIYGANLTFVDLSDVSFYETEVRGQKPVSVKCFIDNIGDKGVVVVLPTPKGCSDGRMVSVTLPENQVAELKSVLKEDWCIE